MVNLCESFNKTLITTNPSNIFYLTGYAADFAILLITGGRAYYLSDSRFTIEAAAKLEREIEFVETTQADALSELLKLIDKAESELLIDMDAPYRECAGMLEALKGYRVSDAAPILGDMRIKKSSDEINLIVKAQRIAERALDELKPYIKEGVSERELKHRLEFLMGMGGSEGTAFDTIVAFGENSAAAHAKPSERTLRHGDIVLFDFGATYGGYRSDMTRTFVYGEPSEIVVRMYEAVLNANIAALESVREGARCGDIDKAARDTLKSLGMAEYFTHSTGHGVGIDIHESPTVGPRSEGVLERGMVITIEPGVYIAGVGGVRIEDMAAVGLGSLTEYPKELELLR